MGGWADLGKAALEVLGKAAPWVVIACLAAFGIYKLQELNQANLAAVQAIAEKERTQARDDFAVANKALKDTYEAANKLYTEMIGSVGSSLKQLQALETEVREKQKAVYQSQIEAEQTKASLSLQQNDLTAARKQLAELHAQAQAELATVEAARKGAAEASAAKDQAEAAAQLLSMRLSRENDELKKTSRDLDQTKHQVEEKREELRQAIGRLKDVSVLVNELARLPENPNKDDIDELRRKARVVLPSVEEFLHQYRNRPAARRNMDTSSLVAIKMSELKQAINATSGYHWFVAHTSVSPYRATRIIAVPDDQRGKSVITSSIVFKLSDLSADKEKTFQARPVTILEENITVQGVELSSAVMFRCLDPERFDKVVTMRLSSDKASWSSVGKIVGEDVPLLEAIGSIFVFIGRAYQLKGETWPLKIQSPASVLKAFPDIIRERTGLDQHWGPALCLRFLESLDILSKITIVVSGLSDSENAIVKRELTSFYQHVFHNKQQFLDVPTFPDRPEGEIAQFGAFVSGIAQSALASFPTQATITSVSVLASRTEGKIRLQIQQPENAPEPLNRISPIYVELADNRVRLVTALVTPK